MSGMSIALARRPHEPIASVRANWGGFVVRHSAGVQTHRLLPQVCRAVTSIPVALRRQEDARGNVQVLLEGMEPWSRLWWEQVARTFTLRTGELGEFVALPEDEHALYEREVVVDHGVWAHDLLESPYRTAPATSCKCGARYVFATANCPKCEGEDPIGILLRDHGEKVDAAAAREIREALTGPGLAEIEVMRDALGVVLAHSNDALSMAPSHDALLQDLDAFYQRQLSFASIESTDVRALATRPTSVACTLMQLIAEVSMTLRLERLGHESPPAWLPSFDMTERLEKHTSGAWSEARAALARFAEHQIAAVLAFVPVRERLVEARRPGPRGVSPATQSPSDALRGALGKKDQAVVDAFVEALDTRDVCARSALMALDACVAAERVICDEARDAAQRYVRWQLASDYSDAPPDRQLEIARRVATSSRVAWKHTVKSRLPPPKRGRKLAPPPKFAGYPVWMWVTGLIVLEVIMIAWMLYKIGGIPI